MGWGHSFLIAFAMTLGAHAATPEQFKVKATAPEIQESADQPALTFEYANAGKVFYTGKLPKSVKESAGEEPDKRFLQADVKLPKKFHLRDLATKLGVNLSPIMDQKSCGSCVYNSVAKNATDHLLLRKVPGISSDWFSRQYAMSKAQWSCNGSLFEYVAGVFAKLAVPFESEYPYRAVDASTRDISGMKTWGPFSGGYKIIDNSPKSIMTALVQGYPVSITVAADGGWSSYSGGIYNRNGSRATNHEILVYGYDCESAVDAEGNCDPSRVTSGVNGVGTATGVNSWNERWGVNGEIVTRWGLNAFAEEAGILESGIPLPGPGPGPGPDPKPPVPFELQAWMIYSIIGLLVLVAVIGTLGLLRAARSEHD